MQLVHVKLWVCNRVAWKMYNIKGINLCSVFFYVRVTVHRNNFFVIKPTRCTNFTNLFWHETLRVSGSSSVHHQEFIHCTLNNGICHTG